MPTCIHLLDENEDEAWCGFLFWGWLCLPVRWQFTCHGIGQLPEIYTKELISHERRKTLVVRSEETHKSPRVHNLPNKCIEINYQEKVNIIACIRTHRLGFFFSRRDIFLKKSDFYHWIYTTMEIHDTFLQKLTPPTSRKRKSCWHSVKNERQLIINHCRWCKSAKSNEK